MISNVEFYGEVCCEVCNEIVHNHMEQCPACNEKYVGTSVYSSFWDKAYFNEPVQFSCECCGTEFTVIDHRNGWYGGDVVVEYKAKNEHLEGISYGYN
jgi:hypothetical protein